MVTGVETAGLVLAAFPIVANGLGSYIAGCNVLIRWRNQRKHGRELRTFQRQLETQQVIYLNTLEDLIDGIVYSDTDKSLLINDPGGPAWTRPEYDTRLRERLGQSYDAYVGTMTDLLESMTFLEERMNLKRPEMLSKRPESIIKKELENFKMVLPGSIYERCLAKIRSANKDLLDLTHPTRYLGFLRKNKRTTTRSLESLIQFRHLVRSLHQLLIRQELWKCQANHNINIRLEPSDNFHSAFGGKPLLRMLVSCEAGPLGGTREVQAEYVPIRRWRDIEIEPVERIIDGATQPMSASPATLEGNTSKQAALKTSGKSDKNLDKRKKLKKAVRFAQRQRVDGTAATVPSSQSFFDAISDICSAVQPPPSTSRECVGFLLGESTATFQRHHVFVIGGHDAPPNQNLISLNLILTPANRRPVLTNSEKLSFSCRDRLFIAATLASSTIQFFGSWLKKFCRSRDVFFLQHGWPTAETKHPYLSWNVLARENNTDKEPLVPLAPVAVDSIHKEVLFPLGLTLTELSLARTWEDMESASDGEPKDIATKLEERLRLVYDESGLRYGDVVRNCLFWRRDSRGKGFEDEEYLRCVFEEIVSPLVENWKDFEGLGAS